MHNFTIETGDVLVKNSTHHSFVQRRIKSQQDDDFTIFEVPASNNYLVIEIRILKETVDAVCYAIDVIAKGKLERWILLRKTLQKGFDVYRNVIKIWTSPKG